MAGTTTNYAFPYPSGTDLAKNGATNIQNLATAVDTTLATALSTKTHAGLVLVKTQTIGTGVSSVTVTGAFSSTYDNYKIIVSGGVGSTSAELALSLDSITTGYYSTLTYQNFGSTTVLGAQTSNLARWGWTGSVTTSSLNLDIELLQPYLAKPKTAVAFYNEMGTAYTNGLSRHYNGSTTQATAFTLTATAGTLTGGTIAVYGYAKD